MPELSLSLDLHLHHGVVGVFDVFQSFIDARKQVDDFLFADQDFTVETNVNEQNQKCVSLYL